MRLRDLSAIAGSTYGALGAYSINSYVHAHVFNSGYESSFQEFCGETLTETLFLPLKGLWGLANQVGADGLLSDIGIGYSNFMENFTSNSDAIAVSGGAIAGAMVFYLAGTLLETGKDLINEFRSKIRAD